MQALPTIKNMTVMAFAQTETQSTGPCGIILVRKPTGEMVTAWYRLGDTEWRHGHYFTPQPFHNDEQRLKLEQDAYRDFIGRVERERYIPKPKPTEADLPALLEAYAAKELEITENSTNPDVIGGAFERRDAAMSILEDLKATI